MSKEPELRERVIAVAVIKDGDYFIGEDQFGQPAMYEVSNGELIIHPWTTGQRVVPRMVADIKAFHEKFELRYDGPPRLLPDKLASFREKFMQEELDEYIRAGEDVSPHSSESRALQFDALIDLVYVALGTAYLHGFDFEEGWRRVHAANMAKVRARKSEDSLSTGRDHQFDIVKPLDWVAPDLSDLVSDGDNDPQI